MLVLPAPGGCQLLLLVCGGGNIPDGPTMAANCPFSIFSGQSSSFPRGSMGKAYREIQPAQHGSVPRRVAEPHV